MVSQRPGGAEQLAGLLSRRCSPPGFHPTAVDGDFEGLAIGKPSGVWQRSGQPEVAEDTGVGEPGDPGDRVPLERQHDQSVGAGDRRLRVR
jgi:hypothetical protein